MNCRAEFLWSWCYDPVIPHRLCGELDVGCYILELFPPNSWLLGASSPKVCNTWLFVSSWTFAIWAWYCPTGFIAFAYHEDALDWGFFFPFNFYFVCSGPCDIIGDVSYEELRAAAYEDAKRGLSLQSIVRKYGWLLESLSFYLFINVNNTCWHHICAVIKVHVFFCFKFHLQASGIQSKEDAEFNICETWKVRMLATENNNIIWKCI